MVLIMADPRSPSQNVFRVGPDCQTVSRLPPMLSRTKAQQESNALARKPRDAAAVLFSLKFANTIHYKFKSSQASKTRLQSSKHTGAKQNLTEKLNGH